MHQQHQRKGSKTKEQQEDARNREKAQNQQMYSGYSKAIFDLLKDPVCFGLTGGNGNRGRQR